MPKVSINVGGLEHFEALSRRLKSGSQELSDEILKTLDDTLRSVPSALRTSARDTLPRRGGLGRDVSESVITVATHAAGEMVTAEISASHRYDIEEIDRGIVHHPLFGDRRHWYTQSVRPGWFTRPIEAVQDRIRPDLERAMDTTARRIEG